MTWTSKTLALLSLAWKIAWSSSDCPSSRFVATRIDSGLLQRTTTLSFITHLTISSRSSRLHCECEHALRRTMHASRQSFEPDDYNVPNSNLPQPVGYFAALPAISMAERPLEGRAV